MISMAQLEKLFTYQPPSGGQLVRYDRIRKDAHRLAATIIELTPASADQSAALRKVREAVMTANASIAMED